MSARITPLADVVTRCVARQDGGWMIVCKKGSSGVSLSHIPEGARVVIREGQAVRTAQ